MPDTRRSAFSEIPDITRKFRGPASEILALRGRCSALRCVARADSAAAADSF
jgi:hypothetical protein